MADMRPRKARDMVRAVVTLPLLALMLVELASAASLASVPGTIPKVERGTR